MAGLRRRAISRASGRLVCDEWRLIGQRASMMRIGREEEGAEEERDRREGVEDEEEEPFGDFRGEPGVIDNFENPPTGDRLRGVSCGVGGMTTRPSARARAWTGSPSPFAIVRWPLDVPSTLEEKEGRRRSSIRVHVRSGIRETSDM
jgi:hypothetical protein